MTHTDIDNLCHQIEAGDLAGVKASLESGSSVNGFSTAGRTPLGTAILQGKADIVKHLLQSGADIQLGYKAELSQDKSDPESNLPDVCPPIHCAAFSGSPDLIRLLVEHGADVNDPSGVDYGAQTFPLFVSKEVATQALIDLGADVTRKNTTGFTALLHAMAREDIISAKLLVENGADVEVERIARYRIRVGASDGTEGTEEQLVEGTSSPLIVASHQGRLRPTSGQMFEILASAGADVNRRYYIKKDGTDISFTVLSLICGSRIPVPDLKGAYAKNDRYGEKEVAAIKALIAAGVDVNDPPVIHFVCQGEMPFQDFGPRFEVFKMLIDHGAHINAPSSVTPQSALLNSFRKDAEAEVQYGHFTTALANAGARGSVP